ncbi:ZIP family metal transporter [Miltoncostaea oceani]|uniref:ZIP family metal transporter n=1 Tax=Miltoncostaea oceani TaxID=2843216 RepID=UPI001C3C5BE3|nr:ZIP family metal transporter [Miltoncostaea oceani]
MEPLFALWMTLAGLGTVIGALGIYVWRSPGDRLLDGGLGFAAGVMLAALSFGLLNPALEQGALIEVITGLVLGVALMLGLDRLVPHLHPPRGPEDGTPDARRRGWLVFGALSLHNIPEGMAVGVAFAVGGTELGLPLAIAIMAHNVPEGFSVAIPFLASRMPRRRIFAVAASSGLIEIPAAFAAFAIVGVASGLLPLSLAFAAGAMLYVCVDELIPAGVRGGSERVVTLSCMLGFILMLVLNQLIAG